MARCSFFGHTLQLSVSSISLQMAAVGRKIVGHFKHSALATTSLKSKKASLNIPQLIQDVSTRWNSTYIMLERLIEQHWAIYGVLHDETISTTDHLRLDLKDEQWQLATDLLAILKALQIAMTALCEEQNISISLIYPVIYSLLKNHLKVNNDDSPKIKKFKQTVSADLKRRYNPENPDTAGEVPILATAIDPRYNNLKFLNTQQQVSIHEKLIELSENMPDDYQDREKSDNTSEPPAKRSSPDTALEFLFGNYFVEEETSVGISEELDTFVKEPTASPETNPLEWWKVNQY